MACCVCPICRRSMNSSTCELCGALTAFDEGPNALTQAEYVESYWEKMAKERGEADAKRLREASEAALAPISTPSLAMMIGNIEWAMHHAGRHSDTEDIVRHLKSALFCAKLIQRGSDEV